MAKTVKQHIHLSGKNYIWTMKNGNALCKEQHIRVFEEGYENNILYLDPYSWNFELRPKMIEEGIRFALKQGWSPKKDTGKMYIGMKVDEWVVLPDCLFLYQYIQLEKDFCETLEYAISRAFKATKIPDWRGVWCDGVFPDATFNRDETCQKFRLVTRAYAGKTGQDSYQMFIYLPSGIGHNMDLCQYIPRGKIAEDWLTLNVAKQSIEVHLCIPPFRAPTENELIVALSTDYGADEYVWYFPYSELSDLLSWWHAQTDFQIFEKYPERLIGEIIKVKTDEEHGFLYSLKDVPKMMLLDYEGGSYLIYRENGIQEKLMK